MKVLTDQKNEEKWFKTHHLKQNLKSHSVTSGASTLSGQMISFVLNISAIIIMGNLLTKEDYGLVGMVTAFTGFVTIFKDLGLSAAVIQRPELTQHQVSSIFWINVIISLIISLLVAVCAPLVVSFYNEPRVYWITIVFSISVLIAGLSLQHNALMKRQMRFKELSFIQIGSTTMSFITGVYTAWIGLGYWAIVFYTILNPIIFTLALWFVCDWRPSFVTHFRGVKSFFQFGIGISGFEMINYFSRNLDNMLIGRYIGEGALGLYTRAYSLLMLPITQLRDPITAVGIPAMTTLQNEKDKFKSYFGRYIFILSFFTMPVVMYLSLFIDEIILATLGEKWIEAAGIFKLLALSAFIQPIASTRGMVLITMGKSKKYFRWGLANAFFVILGFIIGVRWGVEGIAISYAIVNYLLLWPSLKYCFHDTPVTVATFFREISYPLIFSLTSGSLVYIMKPYFSDLPNIITSIVGGAIFCMLYIGLWFINKTSKSRFAHITEIIGLLSNKFLKRS